MKILALEREISQQSADYQPYLKAEAASVWELYQAGLLREIYFHANEHTAVILLECDDEATARELLDSLPLVKAGLITFDIIPLVPYSGFARLFGTEKP
ncbi:MAG: superoxide dismutase [Anaerolineae bacterium]|nr:superoxide dismutase [Anaerolineae bacterium]